MLQHRFNVILFVAVSALVTGMFSQTSVSSAQQPAWGKSHHGSHYDEGPRSKPWMMDGIGKSHFPVTSTDPEVQAWFDQGITLLHGFWFFEAERSFRWCLKLDPDCAMAYWGLARSVQGDRARERRFFREAVERKDKVSKRERDYIEVWEAKYKVQQAADDEKKSAIREYVKRFDNLLINYPDDIEARALYWLEMLSNVMDRPDENPLRYGMDRVLQEVLAKEPDHVGALHYRVHNWDGEEGHYALDTCLHLSKVAPNCGHLQHMPGHVLSSIGLWNEAAIAMDNATRIEKDYMRRRMVLPEDNWDYVHNLDYLCYIQEQLGMFEAAMTGCKQLLRAPASSEYSPMGEQANWSMVRLLVKFEKWDEILNLEDQLLRWDTKGLADPALRSYARTHALIGLGRLDEAAEELRKFESQVALFSLPQKLFGLLSSRFAGKPVGDQKKAKNKKANDKEQKGFLQKMIAIRRWELRGKLALARGDMESGIRMLKKAAEMQYDSWHNDPPRDAVFLYNTLGETYLANDQYDEALEAFEQSLEKIINDGFALSGMVVACHELGRENDAQQFMGRLKAVWKNAELPNRWLAAANATGVQAAPIDGDLLAERDYKSILDAQGHSLWTPPQAPELSAVDSRGHKVSLEDFRSKNVLLIFYLGGECLHCMEQMNEANRLATEFDALETEIIAVSKDDLSTIQSYSSPEFGVTLLSDTKFENARRFHSYDDFEEIELHSTILIDRHGRVHWSRHGGDPFMDFEFLKNEIRHLNLQFPNDQTVKR